MQQEITLADIADAAGTSIVTVSNALKGRKGVSAQLRQKIIALTKSMGYEPKRGERAQEREEPAFNLGVIVPEKYAVEYPSFYMDIYQKIVLAASKMNCFVMLELFCQEYEMQGRLPELLSNMAIDGIMLLGQMEGDYTALLCENSHVPVLFVDYYEDRPDADFVVSSGFYGMYRVTEHLLRHGYRNIAYVGNIHATSSILDRYLGYRKALQEQQLPLRSDWLISDRSGQGQCIPLQLPREMPEAFVCNCDEAAAILIDELEKRGYRVPEDIGVAGFDHYLVKPAKLSLVTWETDMQGMAREAVSTLLKKIRGIPYQKGIRVIDGRLRDGDSIRKTEDREYR